MSILTPLDLHSGYGAEILATVGGLTSPALVTIADRLDGIFAIASPFAPGFRGVGGVVALDDEQARAHGAAHASVTGNGENIETALISCLAEAAELLSQFERNGDVTTTASITELPGDVATGWIADLFGQSRKMDCVSARHAANGLAALLPADICLRRPASRRTAPPPGPLSSGAAAGPNFEAAASRAILELCERDATTLWWHGGKPGRGFPLEHDANRAATALLRRLRDGTADRRSWLLDITAVAQIPVVAAISVDQDGHGLACGIAARCDVGEAAEAAVLEMCQMELSAPVAAAKRAQAGEAALNEADWRHLHRSAFDTANCPLLWPSRMTTLEAAQTSVALDQLVATLNARDIPIFLFDMSRADIGVRVVRAVSPVLQPMAPAITVTTERLRRALDESGGAACTQGISLM